MYKMKDKFDLKEILDLKEKNTAENHTWTSRWCWLEDL